MVIVKKLFEGFCHYFTDAKGRGEIKVVLGLTCVVVAFIRLFQDKGIAEFLALMGEGMLFFGITALADHKTDADAAELEIVKAQCEDKKPDKTAGFTT